MKHKNTFYTRVIKDNPSTETAKLLQMDSECGYYEVCQSFVDVALNAQIIRNDDGSLSGIFQYTDINIAKQKAIDFIITNNIKNIDSFFAVLKREYPFSVSPDDTRRKSGIVKEDGTGCWGYMGTLYFFTNISDNVYANMIEDIKATLMKQEC